jgi:hypothetical protein
MRNHPLRARPRGEPRSTLRVMTDRRVAATPGLMRVGPPVHREAPDSGRGWMAFAGVMLLLGAAFNAVYGFAAIFNDDYLAEEELLYGTVSVWGWVAIGFAVIGVVVALLLFAGSFWGAMLGILVAGVNAIVHVMAIGAHPLWSVIVIVVDGLIIYGLSVHGLGR